MKYNFDQINDRKLNYSAKYDELKLKYGKDDLIPMWIADMDFKTAKPIIDSIINRAEQGIFGYVSRPDSYFESACEWYKKKHEWNLKSEWMSHSHGLEMNDQQLKNFMNNKVKVAFGLWYGKESEGYIRMNVACPRSVVEQALIRLKTAIDKL